MSNYTPNGQPPQVLLGYRRKSMVREQVDLVSPERQMHSCNLWVEIQGQPYTIEWYEDIDGHRSGRYEKGRPGWQTLVQQLERPEVVGVIADSFDRMYRNVHQFLNFLNRLEKLQKRLITVKEGLDSSTAMGRAIVTILMVIYQLESDQTSERMTANVRYKREVLGRHWGPLLFGCDRDEQGTLLPTARVYWLNPATGASLPENGKMPDGFEQRRFIDGLQALYELYGQGKYSYDTVAERMNKAGWRYYADAQGQPRDFSRDDVRRIVSFWRIYRGELVLGNATNDRNAAVIDGAHEPILPVALCNLVGAVKKRRGREIVTRNNDRIYLLSDVIFCGSCGRALKGQFHKGNRWYRHYGGKKNCLEKQVNAQNIETTILQQIAAIADHELIGEIEAESERIMRRISAEDNNTKPLLDELDGYRDRRNRLEELYLERSIEIERYRALRTEINAEIDTLEKRLYDATKTAGMHSVIARIKDILAQIQTVSGETQKALINNIVERIEVVSGVPISFEPRPWAKPFF